MRLRTLTDLFRQKFVSKTLKYTKYSCGFPPSLTKNLSSDALADLYGIVLYHITGLLPAQLVFMNHSRKSALFSVSCIAVFLAAKRFPLPVPQ